MTAVQRICFERRPFEAAATELVAVVDGISLVDLVRPFEVGSGYQPAGGYRGLVPDYFDFGDLAPLFGWRADSVARQPGAAAWLRLRRVGVLAADRHRG